MERKLETIDEKFEENERKMKSGNFRKCMKREFCKERANHQEKEKKKTKHN